MKEFEIRPRLTNSYAMIGGFSSLAISVVFCVFVLPKILKLYSEFPGESDIRWLLVICILFTTFFILVSLLVFISSFGRMVKVEDNLTYFMKKTFVGFGKWKVEKIVDFSKVNIVKDKVTTQILSTGKMIIPIGIYWLVLEMKDGTKQEILLHGWDWGGIKNLFYFIKGKFPEIKFDTKILRDSSEKLAGIDEYLKK